MNPDLDFSRQPFVAIWEMSRACALRCAHCRAEAVTERNPEELTTAQACALLDEIHAMGVPLTVLTGGDPLRRPDLDEILAHAKSLGLHIAMTPSATAEVTRKALESAKKNGLARLAVSLDASSAGAHDRFRGVDGSFGWTMDILSWAHELGLPVQINTTISRHNLDDVDALCALMRRLDIVMWSVFFLVPVGRGRVDDAVRGRDLERVLHKMADLAGQCRFDIKSTEAPHYRRVLIQRDLKSGAVLTQATHVVRAARGVNDGNGFVFISHTGEVYPSGFLPITAGNVKHDALAEVYRTSPLFRRLRDTSQLKGKCGVCEYKFICGGSRARAFAVTGDYMEAEPFCVYVPKGYQVTDEERRYW